MILMIAIILAFGMVFAALVLRGHLEDVQKQPKPAHVGHLKIDATMARSILNVTHESSDEEIKDAYRKLVQKLHPDQGGSAFLMEMVVQAKQVLDRNAK